MKTNLLATMTLAATSLTLAASHVASFPSFMPQPKQELSMDHQGMMRAPLNPTMNLGARVFGVTTIDYASGFHLCDFYTNALNTINKYQSIMNPEDPNDPDNENYPDMYCVLSGGWAGEKWYGYRYKYYTVGIAIVDYWLEADPDTGTYIRKAAIDNDAWTVTNDLAWNPTDNKLYGLQYSTEPNEYSMPTSLLSEIDKSTGMATKVIKQLNDYYFCMAFDYDGMLYAIRWEYDAKGNTIGTALEILDPNDDYKVTKSTLLKVDGKSFKIDYQNTLTFDYTTGDLWWGAANTEAEMYIIKINPDDMTTDNRGTLGYREAVTGMYIPYRVADERTAPAGVENLSFTIDPDGANKVTISWTNPTTTWNRQALSDLKEVRIYRDNENSAPVATLDATGKVGAEMSWTDEGATQGVHTYYIAPCAKAGVKGITNSINAFVGHDVPGQVQKLTAMTFDNKTIDVTWKAPAMGDNEGWYDKSSIKYHIVRLPDNKDLGTQTKTSFTDKTLEEVQMYSYVVTPITDDGEGAPATSGGVLAGSSVKIPFSTTFETRTEADRFSQVDANGDGRFWEYGYNTNISRETYKLDASDFGNDDILVSPPLNVKKGNTYKVKYEISYGGYGLSDRIYMQHIAFVGGQQATQSGLSDKYEDLDEHFLYGLNARETLVTYFTAPVDGEYYFGLELLTDDEKDWWVYIEGFEITDAPDIDLDAEALNTKLVVSNSSDNDFTVKVYNNGASEMKDYKVQIAYLNDGEPVVFAEAQEVPAIKSHTAEMVSVTGHPKDDVFGTKQLVGIVVLDGDGNNDNNMSPAVEVEVDGAQALNHLADGERSSSAHMPFSTYEAASSAQTIYTPDMTGISIPEQGSLELHRLAWEYDGNAAPYDGIQIEVYVDKVDKTGFATAEEWIAPAGAPLFKGSVPFKSGHNFLVADFDEPIEFDPTKPFLVTVNKFELAHSGNFDMQFNIFDEDWSVAELHTLEARGGNTMMDVKAPQANFFRMAGAPVLHLALANKVTGVEEIVLTGKATYFFNSNTGVLHANNGNLSTVEVFDLAGQLIKRVNVSSSDTQINLGLSTGMYVLRMTEKNGCTATLKVKAN